MAITDLHFKAWCALLIKQKAFHHSIIQYYAFCATVTLHLLHLFVNS
jgi:hypothetical protein